MEARRPSIIWLAFVLWCGFTANAQLAVKVSEPKTTSTKTIIKLTIRNNFAERVESARATIFLLNEEGKMVGQSTQWVIGGTKERQGLEPDKETTFYFAVPTDKPFKESRLVFNRIVLQSGKTVDPSKSVQV